MTQPRTRCERVDSVAVCAGGGGERGIEELGGDIGGVEGLGLEFYQRGEEMYGC